MFACAGGWTHIAKIKCKAWGAACSAQWKQGQKWVPGVFRTTLQKWGKTTVCDLAPWCIYSQPAGPAEGRSCLWTGGFPFRSVLCLQALLPGHRSASVLQLTLKAGRSRMHHGHDALTPLTAGRAQQLPALLRRGAGHSQGSPTVWADV